jgi:hypothetical protein
MSLPAAPPPLAELLASTPAERVAAVVQADLAALPANRYLHWDQLRRLPAPPGFSHSEWWLAIKLARRCARRPLTPPGEIGSGWSVVLSPGTWSWLMRLHGALGPGSPLHVGLAQDPRGLERLRWRALGEEARGSAALSGGEGTVAGLTEALSGARGWADRPITVEEVRHLVAQTLPGAVHGSVDIARLSWVCRFADGTGGDSGESGVPLHGLLRAAIVPGLCLALRPLAAGNGRLGRLLGRWCLIRAGYPLSECLAPSAELAQTPARYRRALEYAGSDDGDLSYLMERHLRALWQSVRTLERELDRDEARARSARARLADVGPRFGLNDRQLRLVFHGLEHPGWRYEIADHQRRHGTTYQTARTDLLGLAALGLLERGKRGRAFVFVSPDDLAERLKSNPAP